MEYHTDVLPETMNSYHSIPRFKILFDNLIPGLWQNTKLSFPLILKIIFINSVTQGNTRLVHLTTKAEWAISSETHPRNRAHNCQKH